MGAKAQIKHIPYKIGTILYSKTDEDGYKSKIKILKYNGQRHYRIAVYYRDSHEMIVIVYSHVHLRILNKNKFILGLSGMLKRL